MKVVVCIVLVLIASIQVNATHVNVVGEIENHKFIDRELVYLPPHVNDVVSRTFTFPPSGPTKSNFIITGYEQIDEVDSPNVEIASGGIGTKHISMIVTSNVGKQLATTFKFYGDKIHEY